LHTPLVIFWIVSSVVAACEFLEILTQFVLRLAAPGIAHIRAAPRIVAPQPYRATQPSAAALPRHAASRRSPATPLSLAPQAVTEFSLTCPVAKPAAPGAAAVVAAPLAVAPQLATPHGTAPQLCRASLRGATGLSRHKRGGCLPLRVGESQDCRAMALLPPVPHHGPRRRTSAAPRPTVPRPAMPPAVAPQAWNATPQSLSAPWRGVDAQACRAMSNGAAPPYISNSSSPL
jgi:hypothetical protein